MSFKFSNSKYLCIATWLQESLKLIQESWIQTKIPKDSKSSQQNFEVVDPLGWPLGILHCIENIDSTIP